MNIHLDEKNDFFILINSTTLYDRVIANILINFLRKNSGKCLVAVGVPLNTIEIFNNLETIDTNENVTLDVKSRVQFKVPEEKSVQGIISLGASLSTNDTLVVAGFEKFISKWTFNSQNTIEYDTVRIRTFSKTDINWIGIADSLELLRSNNFNTVVVINCEDACKDRLFKAIEEGDWDVGILEVEEKDEEKEVYNFQIEIVNNIGKVEKEELIRRIEENERLSSTRKEILKAQVHIANCDRAEAIRLLPAFPPTHNE